MQIGLPITGKYRDPESDQYYNNNDVNENYILNKVQEFLFFFEGEREESFGRIFNHFSVEF